jgi:hypothetical protein
MNEEQRQRNRAIHRDATKRYQAKQHAMPLSQRAPSIQRSTRSFIDYSALNPGVDFLDDDMPLEPIDSDHSIRAERF